MYKVNSQDPHWYKRVEAFWWVFVDCEGRKIQDPAVKSRIVRFQGRF